MHHKTHTSQWCDTRLKGKLFWGILSQNDVGFRTKELVTLANTWLLIDPEYPSWLENHILRKRSASGEKLEESEKGNKSFRKSSWGKYGVEFLNVGR